MNETVQIQVFLDLLENQTSLIDTLAGRELILQDQVTSRDWTAVETIISEMTALSEAIARVEEKRNEKFLEIALGLGCSSDFTTVLTRLPPDIRSEISQRYRALKVSVLRLQNHTANMDAYLRSSLATNRSILRELYPEHAASGYSSDGQGRLDTGTALMINQHH